MSQSVLEILKSKVVFLNEKKCQLLNFFACTALNGLIQS